VRILHVCAYFAPAFSYGGPPRSVLGLCKALRSLGVDAEVLTTTANGADELTAGRREFEGVPVEYVPRSFPKRFFNAAGFGRRLDELLPGFDLTHIHGLWNLAVWKACAAARRNKKRYVVSPRGMLDAGSFQRRSWLKRIAYPLVERNNLSNAAFLHATSEAEAEGIHRLNLPTPVEVVPNGVDFLDPDLQAGRALRTKLGIGEVDPVALYLGRIAPLKRLDLLAAAFKIVLHSMPNAKLLIAGPDEGNHLASLRKQFAPLGGSAHFLGEIDGEGKRGLFAAADVSVCCSESESFGMSIAEGLGAGVPAVVTKTCPWADLNEVGAGRWVEQSVTAMAAGMIEALADLPRAKRMGETGRTLVRDKYSWDGVGRAMIGLYEGALR